MWHFQSLDPAAAAASNQGRAAIRFSKESHVMQDQERIASLSRRAAIVLTGGLVASLGGHTAEAKKRKKKKPKPFSLVAADMTGDKEVDPNPGDPNATGSGEFVISGDKKGKLTICVEFTFNTTTPDSEVILSHIHQGTATENGNIVVDFNGSLDTCVPISQSLANQIKANPAGFYANIHTNNFTGGAARDQLALLE